jgi:hypothetical protein
MRKTFLTFCVAALSLLAVSSCGKIEDSLNDLKTGLENLTARVDKLEKDLNDKISQLSTKISDLDAAYKLADADLLKKLQDGDKALADELTALTAKLDALDGEVDGYIKSNDEALAAAIKAYQDDLKKLADSMTEAQKQLAATDEALLKALTAVGVTKVEKNAAGNAVLTFTDGTTLEVPANPGTGIVTVVEDEVGNKFWAVVVNGETVNLEVPVGHNELEFKVDEDGALLYSVDGGANWSETGAYVAEDADSLIDFYQGETDEMDWETDEMIKEDFYTVVFGGETYYLPIYKVDNSVVSLKAGKTYFEYCESVTVDVVISDITSLYVMTKPDGWRASLEGKKLTVTAPAEDAVEAGYAEADGEVLLHATTAEGKCKIVKFAVATTPGFSLTVTEDGELTIVNPEVVTQTNMWGETMTDFNDALVGLAPVAAFEASPVAYVENIDNNWDDNWYYLSNWKMNTADMDEDWNMIYTIGGEYVPGEYEIDVIETTVPQMYADWTYGDEIPATPFVVWACPMNENGMPRVEDLVYAYYYPSIKATVTAVAATTTDVEVEVKVVGANEYYVGMVAEEQLYGFPIDTYMQMQEGPFGYFQMALQYGMADYAFQQMGTPFGGEYGEEMPETITASMLNYGQPLMPNTKFYIWVFPVVDGLDLADYTYEKNLKPYIYEFETEGLTAGGSATVEFGEPNLSFTSMAVEVNATEGATMIYYNWYDEEEYNSFDEDALAEELLGNGFVIAGASGVARNSEKNVAPGSEYFLVALAVDAEGKYGEVEAELFAAPKIVFSETFKATFGEATSSVFSTGYRYDFPINVEGGTAAKYYYTFGTKEFTDEELANLPLSYEYSSSFKSTTSVSEGKLAGQFAYASSTYYLAVVVESTTGELSPVIKMTVEVPAVPEAEE